MSEGEILLLLLGLGTLAARVGLCLYLAGLSRAKNAAAAVSRVAADLCVAVVVFWAVGHALMGGGLHALFGMNGSFEGAEAFFLTTMILIATGAALGGTMGRTKFAVPLVGSAVLAGLVTPLAAHWAWSGWLHQLGFIDVGGASFLHLCGGAFALAGAIAAGPRGGKYNHDGSANMVPGHDFTQTAAGAIILAVSLLPQLMGCTILHGVRGGPAQAAANGLLAAAAGGLAGLIIGRARYMVTDAHFVLIGMLGGVIAVSAAAGRLPSLSVVVIAGIAGLLSPMACVWLDAKRRIDDPGAGIAIHGVSAIWGLLATGLLVQGPNGRVTQLLVQAAGIGSIGALALAVGFGVFLLMRATIGLRLNDADELDGSDLAEHDLNAYPDFQQNMIKSYHLRET